MPVGELDIDGEVRRLLDRGEVDRATELALRTYGSELIGWLCAVLPRDADAYDAFSYASEALWKSLPTFASRCSVRAWCYMLARQAIVRVKSPSERAELVSRSSLFEVAVSNVWNTTRREQVRNDDIYTQIRKTLDEEDEMLLILRVDRNLAWRDIALILDGELADDDALTRRTAGLRKQFERVKLRLRELAAAKLAD